MPSEAMFTKIGDAISHKLTFGSLCTIWFHLRQQIKKKLISIPGKDYHPYYQPYNAKLHWNTMSTVNFNVA